jgi:hypothetical protein
VQIAKREEYSIYLFDIFVKVWFCYFVKERKIEEEEKGL